MKTWIVTGGAGFIGCNFARMALAEGVRVVVYDKLTYAGNLKSLEDVAGDPNFAFVRADIADRAALDRAVRGEAAGSGAVGARSYYLQLPSQRVWGEPIEGQPPEPLDGWFGSVSAGGARVLAVFGLYPGRAGFTAVQVDGPRPGRLARQDGTPLFASRLEGGRAAGLHSVAGAEELLELAYRCHALLGPEGPAPGSQRLTAA